jgi:hypothetical protein
MPKLIEFTQDWFAEVESAPGRMQQVAFRCGTKFRAVVCLTDNSAGDTPTADLQLTDGTTAKGIPLAYFSVANELARAA